MPLPTEAVEAAVAVEVGEAAVAAEAEEPVALVVAAEEPVAAGPVVAGPEVPVELAPLELVLVRELVAARELVAVVAAAVTVMMSDLTLVHADGFTRAASARECFVSKGAISLGLAAAGLVGLLLVGLTNACPSRVGMCGGTRRTCATFTGLTTRSG